MRAQRRGRRGPLRGRPPRQPRGHSTISLQQTSREIDTQPSTTSDSGSDEPTARLTSDVDQGRRCLTHTMSPFQGVQKRLRIRIRSHSASCDC